jgi:hypothetical protein
MHRIPPHPQAHIPAHFFEDLSCRQIAPPANALELYRTNTLFLRAISLPSQTVFVNVWNTATYSLLPLRLAIFLQY